MRPVHPTKRDQQGWNGENITWSRYDVSWDEWRLKRKVTAYENVGFNIPIAFDLFNSPNKLEYTLSSGIRLFLLHSSHFISFRFHRVNLTFHPCWSYCSIAFVSHLIFSCLLRIFQMNFFCSVAWHWIVNVKWCLTAAIAEAFSESFAEASRFIDWMG